MQNKYTPSAKLGMMTTCIWKGKLSTLTVTCESTQLKHTSDAQL